MQWARRSGISWPARRPPSAVGRATSDAAFGQARLLRGWTRSSGRMVGDLGHPFAILRGVATMSASRGAARSLPKRERNRFSSDEALHALVRTPKGLEDAVIELAMDPRNTRQLAFVYNFARREYQVVPTSTTVLSALRASARVEGMLNFARQVMEDAEAFMVPLNAAHYNSFFTILSKSHSGSEAYMWLLHAERRARRATDSVDTVGYSLVVQALAANGLIEKALNLLETMRRKYYKPTSACLSFVVDGLVESNRPRLAVDLLTRMAASGQYPQGHTVTHVLLGAARKNDVDAAILCLDMLTGSWSMNLNTDHLQSLLEVGGLEYLVQAAYTNHSRDLAERAWPFFEKFGGIPSRSAYASLIYLRGVSGDLKAALDLLVEYNTVRVNENTPSLTYEELIPFISGIASDERLVHALYAEILGRFGKMEQQDTQEGEHEGPQKTATQGNTLLEPLHCVILGYGFLRNIDNAFKVFDAISQTFLMKTESNTFACMMHACSLCGQARAVGPLLQEMRGLDLERTSSTVRWSASMNASTGRLDIAQRSIAAFTSGNRTLPQDTIHTVGTGARIVQEKSVLAKLLALRRRLNAPYVYPLIKFSMGDE
ncbi:Pentatricopeptide repeat-containing protein [Porphyridium purpureum]|uniref:Pentatricopeptide repeat-containing protein n=1 Tax=Porphyridium purpureum TaxID=35688 RepID=A0A5J4YM06_PORPP|nr:Pentatricopeptide repeat-containing protein [Porphyridium purpureum]|eukprot:POR8490..scf295_9